MYKVFIDNKVIIFTEISAKTHETTDFVTVNVSDPLRIDLVKCRNELPDDVTLLVYTPTPEETMRKVFADWYFMEAAGGLVRRGKDFLFIERHGFWDIPKGKMEKGERPEETAVREVEEECGIEGPVIDRFLGHTYHTFDRKGRLTLKRTWWYLMNYDGPEALSPQAEESITQAVWLPEQEWGKVLERTFSSIPEVLSMYRDV